MALIITIDHVNVREFHADVDSAVVRTSYLLEEADGTVVARGQANFWQTLPPDPTPEDYQLPSAALTELQGIRDGIKTAIESNLGV
jgi:hypothetical protein